MHVLHSPNGITQCWFSHSQHKPSSTDRCKELVNLSYHTTKKKHKSVNTNIQSYYYYPFLFFDDLGRLSSRKFFRSFVAKDSEIAFIFNKADSADVNGCTSITKGVRQ